MRQAAGCQLAVVQVAEDPKVVAPHRVEVVRPAAMVRRVAVDRPAYLQAAVDIRRGHPRGAPPAQHLKQQASWNQDRRFQHLVRVATPMDLLLGGTVGGSALREDQHECSPVPEAAKVVAHPQQVEHFVEWLALLA